MTSRQPHTLLLQFQCHPPKNLHTRLPQIFGEFHQNSFRRIIATFLPNLLVMPGEFC
jgi:hypothetical protein